MGINIRQKGQTGEREIARALNSVVIERRARAGLPELHEKDYPFQRNQNQSAVGGSDLSNPYHLEIEVKRQETLSINTWWNQCIVAASRTGGVPILIYRQNRKPWKVIMNIEMPPCDLPIRAEISWDDFLQWFAASVDIILKQSHSGQQMTFDF